MIQNLEFDKNCTNGLQSPSKPVISYLQTMATVQDSSKKIAFVSLPQTAMKRQCNCQQTSCTCFRVCIPQLETRSTDFKEKYLQQLEELEKEHNLELEDKRNLYDAQVRELRGRLHEVETRAQTERENFEKIINSPKPQIIDRSEEVRSLHQRVAELQKQKDNLIRNKVSFIEANLTQKNTQLQNQIVCLKLHHKQQLQSLQKSLRDKQVQHTSSLNLVKQDKLKSDLRIQTLDKQIRNITESLAQQVNNRNQERLKCDELIREVTRLKMELQYQGQTGKSEVQVLRERLEEVKDRLASADNKVGFLTKEKEEQFRAAVEQKAELERRDRVIKELEGVLRFKEEEFNARFRDIDAELQNRINTHKADLNVKNEQIKKLDIQWGARLRKAENELVVLERKLNDDFNNRLRAVEEENRKRILTIQQESTKRIEALKQQHLKQTMKIPQRQSQSPRQPQQPRVQYVYIQKSIQNPQLKIVKQNLLQLTSERISLLGQLEDLRLENDNLKEKINFLNQQEVNFTRQKQRWRLEREELMKQMAELEERVKGKARFQYAVEKIIDNEARQIKRSSSRKNSHQASPLVEPKYRYREDTRVVDHLAPDLSYKVLTPEDMYFSARVEGDIKGKLQRMRQSSRDWRISK